MRILVTGSRDWDDYPTIYRELWRVCDEFDLNHVPDEDGNTMPDPRKVTVVHGDCPTGADHWADEWCIGNFFEAECHPADWGRHDGGCPDWHWGLPKCKRAGFRRNADMVALGADLCLAFIKDASKGATMTVGLAEAAGIPVRRFTAN